jgi:phosphatidylcholine synthase
MLAGKGQRGFDVPSPIVVRAFAVHLFTATGVALGFAALLAAFERHWTLMFWCLGAALFVDGIDGTLARKYRVAEVLPRWSGDVLDLVIDFVTYVFVPAYAIATSGLLPPLLDWLASLAIVVTGALYFADRNMKTSDNYFRGFPALWNAVAFYLFILKPEAWIAAGTIAALAVLTFAPIKFLHPFRVKRLQHVTFGAVAIWAVLAMASLVYDLRPDPWIAYGLVITGLYFFAVGFIDQWVNHD